MTRISVITRRTTKSRRAQGSCSAGLADPAAGQLIGRSHGGYLDLGRLGRLGRQLSQAALDFLPHSPERDAEYALAALEQVHDLVRRGAGIDADSVAHQGHLGQVGISALTEELHRGPDLLQRDPRVQQPLDYLEYQDVAEAVETLRPRPAGRAHAGLDEPGAGPVVQLPVGNARRRAGDRATEANILGHRDSSAATSVLAEQQLLLLGPQLAGAGLASARLNCGSTGPGRRLAALRHRHAHLRPGTPYAQLYLSHVRPRPPATSTITSGASRP